MCIRDSSYGKLRHFLCVFLLLCLLFLRFFDTCLGIKDIGIEFLTKLCWDRTAHILIDHAIAFITLIGAVSRHWYDKLSLILIFEDCNIGNLNWITEYYCCKSFDVAALLCSYFVYFNWILHMLFRAFVLFFVLLWYDKLTPELFYLFTRQSAIKPVAKWNDHSVLLVIEPLPVSYTHLDVYKRQK